MRILLLHPEDSIWGGDWSRVPWDLVVDLGFASPFTYAEWSRSLGTRVVSIFDGSEDSAGYRWVRQKLEPGRGKLLDRMGLDWWELLAVCVAQDLRILYLLDRLAGNEIQGEVEMAGTRPHLLSRMLGHMLKTKVRYFDSEGGVARRVSRMWRSARQLLPAQIAEIALDKWDATYQVRRHFNGNSRANLTESAVLLPSAYSNVTRSALAYAQQVPNQRFVLAVTRRSALPESIPPNVTAVPLSAYACSSSAIRAEAADMKRSWEQFRQGTLREIAGLEPATEAGVWNFFPLHLENGLRLRETWNQILNCEPVIGVLCGDDLNYYTRLPLLLAQRLGLNSVYCSHGALDGGFLFKLPAAEVHLVKGEMEREYLERVCSLAGNAVVVAAPGANSATAISSSAADALVFFSQPFEVEGGRPDEIYRELMPPLFSVALRSSHKLVVKLHPFESKKARTELIASILPRNLIDRVEVIGGVSPEAVFGRAWCGVTVNSSVAVECALRKIPFFLCAWLDFGGTEYLAQFLRFDVGHALRAPEEIEQIPSLVSGKSSASFCRERLWQAADPSQLEHILFGQRQARLHPCA